MLVVDLGPSRQSNYAPLTVNGPDYLMELGRFIARTIADVEVRAHPDYAMATETVFRSECGDEDAEMAEHC
ncbi:hypothetical protein H261_08413 [Paramagnetospirillum caucaseum]|uniref:Uncharacterized protein n=1 Tax=Paramagnetospirillum caucaseum TaxID=1244869 RepID=M2YBV6_9PROT|nr:hypothetical protein [Paramagnetospirillum caucaseum]EME70491.1 hypothetical protein H261_08413 [Paramagnetospirillum caucaseum]